MSVRVSINGFGRIGRNLFRLLINNPDINVVAINDLADAKTLAHLLKYDSAQGKFNADIKTNDHEIIINGDIIKFYSTRNPEDLPWGKLNVDVVMECTGAFTDRATAEQHLHQGAGKVLFSQPAQSDVDATVVSHDAAPDVIDKDDTCLHNIGIWCSSSGVIESSSSSFPSMMLARAVERAMALADLSLGFFGIFTGILKNSIGPYISFVRDSCLRTNDEDLNIGYLRYCLNITAKLFLINLQKKIEDIDFIETHLTHHSILGLKYLEALETKIPALEIDIELSLGIP